MDSWMFGWLGDQPGGFIGRSIHGGAGPICLISWTDWLIDGWLDGRMNGRGLVNSIDSVPVTPLPCRRTEIQRSWNWCPPLTRSRVTSTNLTFDYTIVTTCLPPPSISLLARVFTPESLYEFLVYYVIIRFVIPVVFNKLIRVECMFLSNTTLFYLMV